MQLSNDAKIWRDELGLLPVPLFADREHQALVMLNGARGNLCFDVGAEPLDRHTRNQAWSCDVGHYVRASEKYIEVQQWDRGLSTIERYSRSSVFDKLEEFHLYLEQHSPRRELSIVSHTIGVFRTLRATLGGDFSGQQSLQALLFLFASVTDGSSRSDLDIERWGLPSSARDIANHIRNADWDTLQTLLLKGRQLDKLNPEIELLLRHASGQVFQEAHYEASIASQLQMFLPGYLPAPVKPQQDTKAMGVYYTPAALARSLVEQTLAVYELKSDEQLTIFDPACGSGEFLRETLRQLALRGFNGSVKLIGWDVSPTACNIATFSVATEIRSVSFEANAEILCVDALDAETRWPEQVDIVLMNPPFIGTASMDSQQKAQLREVLGEFYDNLGRADYSYAFLLKAAVALKQEGVLGCVTPSSILDGKSARNLRGIIADLLDVRLVAKLGSQLLFHNAEVDSAIFIGKRGVRNPLSQPSLSFWSDHQSKSASAGFRVLRRLTGTDSWFNLPYLGSGFDIYHNPHIGTKEYNWAPRPYTAWELSRKVENMPRLLSAGKIFEIKQGAITGRNKAFLVDRDYVLHLPKRERRYFRPAIVNQSVLGGMLNDGQYVFYPYFENIIETEEKLRRSLPRFFADRLEPQRAILETRARRGNVQWWELTRPRTSIHRPGTAKIVSTYFGDEGAFAWDSTGDYVVVHGYSWVFRGKHSELSSDENLHDGHDEIEELPYASDNLGYAYAALLNSNIFFTLLAATAPHVGGGQWNLSKRYVHKIKIPNLFSAQADPTLISDLERMGRFDGSHPFERDSASDSHYTQLVKLAYGIEE